MRQYLSQKGQTLVEVVVVTGLLVMVLVGVVSAISATVSRNRRAKDSTVATRLAQEGVEWIKYWREAHGWQGTIDLFYPPPSGKTYCMSGDNTPKTIGELNDMNMSGECSNYGGDGLPDDLKREVFGKYDSSSDEITVTAKVWSKGVNEPLSELTTTLKKRQWQN